MGTEISGLPFINSLYSAVKLNNPLMGTEILSNNNVYLLHSPPHVKLNNPLMGTEITAL